MHSVKKKYQFGQSMVEFIVVLVFGVMVLTIGPGGDVLLDLLAMINNKYQGYSYAASLSDLPQYDSIGHYVDELGVVNPHPNELVEQIRQFTNPENFPSPPSLPGF